MKTCPGCKITKPLTAFASNIGRSDSVQSYCRKCKSLQDHTYYAKNREAHYARVKRLLQVNKGKLWNYLKSHPCVDCGENNPIVLEFDHVKSGKKGSISFLINNLKYSWPSIELEIEKCEVRCANCHRIKTFKQFGWHKPVGV